MSLRLRLLKVLGWIYLDWSARERVESSCTDRFLEVAKLALHFVPLVNELLYLKFLLFMLYHQLFDVNLSLLIPF